MIENLQEFDLGCTSNLTLTMKNLLSLLCCRYSLLILFQFKYQVMF